MCVFALLHAYMYTACACIHHHPCVRGCACARSHPCVCLCVCVCVQYNDVCWQGGPPDPWDLDQVFPTAAFKFESGASLPLKPLQYLFVLSPGSYCLGIFDNGNQGTLIGGIAVRNVLVQVRTLVCLCVCARACVCVRVCVSARRDDACYALRRRRMGPEGV